MARPLTTEYAPFYETYVSLVPDENIVKALDNSLAELESFLTGLPENKMEYAYADGKWTVKQLLQHVIDAERIFCYRALSVARGEKQNLPGFDENEYAKEAVVDNRELKDLKEEFLLLRRSTLSLFKSFTPEMILHVGTANKNPISARALGYIIVGHWKHHQSILRERYLV